MSDHSEYLRRNLQVASAYGARAGLEQALDHALKIKSIPAWLIAALEGAADRVLTLPSDLAAWRDCAPDAPDFARQMTTPTYTQADLDAAVAAALDVAPVKPQRAYQVGYVAGRASGIRDAATAIAALPTGKTDELNEGHEQAYRAVEALLNTLGAVAMWAKRDAETLGAGYIRVNPDGSTDLLDPAAIIFAPDHAALLRAALDLPEVRAMVDAGKTILAELRANRYVTDHMPEGSRVALSKSLAALEAKP